MRYGVGTSYVVVRVQQETREKLEELARRSEVGLTHVLRWAIRDYVQKHFEKDNGHG